MWITFKAVENQLLCKVPPSIAFYYVTIYVYISYPPTIVDNVDNVDKILIIYFNCNN